MQIPAQIEAALSKGLIAAIAQDATSGEVLMLAWMNAEALTKTIETKRATYFSRSRNSLWIKGELQDISKKLFLSISIAMEMRCC